MKNDRILLVDDEPVVRRAHGRILESFGLDVTVAASGEEACEHVGRSVAEGKPFSVAVVDRAMPGMDGFATIERVWKLDPEIQVVLCTGSECSVEDLSRRFADSDALLLIRKPIDPVELIQATRTLSIKRRLAARVRAELASERAWREQVENELRLSGRLEAIGQLAAGIAHEINSPVQYIGDNAAFVCESSAELFRFVDELREMIAGHPELAARLSEREQELDLEYIRKEMPIASQAMQVGTRKIGSIVSALRELSHPGTAEPIQGDVNRALASALEISSSAYRYHCVVDFQPGNLPQVMCHIDELGQVFVNLIVNAAHAMETPERKARGKLGVRTYVADDHVVIEIADTGCGIPPALQKRVFDPFFTTKPVGRGTGQGLAIARAIVVERHGGDLSFDSEPGVGTRFHIRLPIEGCARRVA